MKNLDYLETFNQAVKNIIENLGITETELQLSNKADFALSFKTRLIEEIERQNGRELLKESLNKWLNQLTSGSLTENILEQASTQTTENTYEYLIEEIKNKNLPSSIIEAWEAARRQYKAGSEKPLTHPPLFINSQFEPLSTAVVIMSALKAQIKKDGWGKDTAEIAFYQHKGKQPNQIIEHYISQSSNIGDISILPWSEAWQIIENFNFSTAKLHILFAAHCMKQENPWENQFSLKSSDIIKEIGWDKRTDLTKSELLKQVASAAYTLDCLTVKVEWETGQPKKGKIPIMIDISRLWTISFKYQGQKDIFTSKIEDPKEIYITVRPGMWASSFLNAGGAAAKNALYQFGYIAQEVLKIDPYHDELALRLAIHLSLESRYHQSGYYKVGTLLKSILPGAELTITKAITDRRQGYELKQRWDNALKLLTSLNWQIIYDSQTYLNYLHPGSTERKPNGYWNILLEANITILPPTPIPTLLANIGSQKHLAPLPQKKSSPTPLTGVAITEARKAKEWTQVKLAGFLGISQALMGMIEKGRRFPQPDLEKRIRELLDLD